MNVSIGIWAESPDIALNAVEKNGNGKGGTRVCYHSCPRCGAEFVGAEKV
jgi:hypothetical protein